MSLRVVCSGDLSFVALVFCQLKGVLTAFVVICAVGMAFAVIFGVLYFIDWLERKRRGWK